MATCKHYHAYYFLTLPHFGIILRFSEPGRAESLTARAREDKGPKMIESATRATFHALIRDILCLLPQGAIEFTR
jgi:hypothetical protein